MIDRVEPPDFDRLYADGADPWSVATSWYEQRKIAVVLASLTRPRYERALDPACGTGHLAALLGARCGQVVACDMTPGAVEHARQVCAQVPNVDVRCAQLPYRDGDPAGPFDLLVLSEFLYYLDAEDRRASVDSLLRRASEDVDVVVVHWSDRPDDGATSGVQAQHEAGHQLVEAGFERLVAHIDEEFLLDVYRRTGDRGGD